MVTLAAVAVLVLRVVEVAVSAAVVVINNHTKRTRSNFLAIRMITTRLRGILLIDHNNHLVMFLLTSSSSSSNPMVNNPTYLLRSICNNNSNNHRPINNPIIWQHRLGERLRLLMDKFITTIRLRKRRSGTDRRECLKLLDHRPSLGGE